MEGREAITKQDLTPDDFSKGCEAIAQGASDTKSSGPQSSGVSRQDARGSNSRTRPSNGVSRIAKSNTVKPRMSAREMFRQRAQITKAQRAAWRQQQLEEARISGSGMTPRKRGKQPIRGSGSQPQRDYGMSIYGPPAPPAKGPVTVPGSANVLGKLRIDRESQTAKLTDTEKDAKFKRDHVVPGQLFGDSGGEGDNEGDSESSHYASWRTQNEQKRDARDRRVSGDNE